MPGFASFSFSSILVPGGVRRWRRSARGPRDFLEISCRFVPFLPVFCSCCSAGNVTSRTRPADRGRRRWRRGKCRSSYTDLFSLILDFLDGFRGVSGACVCEIVLVGEFFSREGLPCIGLPGLGSTFAIINTPEMQPRALAGEGRNLIPGDIFAFSRFRFSHERARS